MLSQLQKLSAEYTSIVNAAKPLLQRLDEVPSARTTQRCVRAAADAPSDAHRLNGRSAR
jgi:hypothetical protein